MPGPYPIVYVRGYAGTQSDVEETTDDPTNGFNAGSTHIRLDQDGKADFFMFVSPFARLFRDHGYQDVIDGAVQQLPPASERPRQTIWIYRYYDPTSKTFDRPGGRRLSVIEASHGLKDFIEEIRKQVTAREAQLGVQDGPCKVYLVAHSMGGLICRCLLQKIYAEGQAQDYVDKLFTYGTPHGGIHFDLAGGRILEKLRDLVGYHDSDNFGPQKMYEFLTRDPGMFSSKRFDPRVMPEKDFDPDRVFCIIGTNAEDYAVAAGLSRTAVGPQSDGLVQIDSAYVRGAHRAYIHRSHSGRYGMVNSEEGYQNLQRFLFGDVKVKASLTDFTLDFSANADKDKPDVTYFIETQVSIRGLPVLVHERTLRHFCAEAINRETYLQRYATTPNELPLFTNFLLNIRRDNTMRYMIRIALYCQQYQDGFLVFKDHLERLPMWSDYLIVELRQRPKGARGYDVSFCWASEKESPDQSMLKEDRSSDTPVRAQRLRAALTGEKAAKMFGTKAVVRFETSFWSENDMPISPAVPNSAEQPPGEEKQR